MKTAEKILILLLIPVLILFFAHTTEAKEVIYIKAAVYSKGDIKIKDIGIVDAPYREEEKGNIKITARSNNIENAYFFPVSFRSIADGMNESYIKEVEYVSKTFKIPYNKDYNYLDFYKDGEYIATINIPEEMCIRRENCNEYCEIRGYVCIENKIEDNKKENRTPSPSKECDYKTDNICNPECPEGTDPDCKIKENKTETKEQFEIKNKENKKDTGNRNTKIYLIGIVIIILIVIIVLLAKNIKKEE